MPEADRLIPPEMIEAIKRYDAEVTSVLQGVQRTIEATATPPALFHYTGSAGLAGILETGQLHFTDIFALNDPSELRHGLSIAISLLKAKATDQRPEVARFAKMVEEFGGIEAAGHHFVFCFSSDDDDLGQWRAYADNGQGFALGFDTQELEDGFTSKEGDPLKKHVTFPVTYDDERLKQVQSAIVDRVDPLISLPRTMHVSGAELNAYMQHLLGLHSFNVITAVIFFKHQAYIKEREYRFQQIFRGDNPAPAVKYRRRGTSLVRYREFDWRKHASRSLRRIVIGPAAERGKATRFAKDCLAAFHADTDSVEIVYSNIPYRV